MHLNSAKLYEKIKLQREYIKAPVDTCGLAGISKKYNDEQYKFLLLISLMLSSQTKDEFTFDAVDGFIKSGIISCEALYQLSEHQVKELIKKVGFAKTKTKYLMSLAETYRTKKLPTNYQELLTIKGVGSKMAILYMYFGCGVIEGISVDTHVHRISRIIGLSDKKTAEGCRKDLENMFPSDEWPNINHVLVGFGQVICKAIKPKCEICCISQECPNSKIKEW